MTTSVEDRVGAQRSWRNVKGQEGKGPDWPSSQNLWHTLRLCLSPARWQRDHSSWVHRGYEHISICFDSFVAFVGPRSPCSLVRLPGNSIPSRCFMDHTGFLPLRAYPVSSDTAGRVFKCSPFPICAHTQTLLQNRGPGFGDHSLGVYSWAVWTSIRVFCQFCDIVCVFCTGWHCLGLWGLLQASFTRLHCGGEGAEYGAGALSTPGSWKLSGIQGQ